MPIALATLVVSLTAVVTLAGLASTTKLTREVDRSTVMADDLLAAAEGPILHWLRHESARVVLPDDIVTPMVHVMHDLWSADGIEHELRITAWDQCGMVPASAMRSSSMLRLVMPDDVLSMVDTATLDLTPFGLDSLSQESRRNCMFPQAAENEHVTFGDATIAPRFKKGSSEVAIGAVLATHQSAAPQQLRRDVPLAIINVNTAPLPLLAVALRETGRSGVEQIAAARSSGEATGISSLAREIPTASGASGGRTLNFVGVSNAWSFRIDVRVGNVVRSWWAVYVSSPASEQEWEVVQRLVIDC